MVHPGVRAVPAVSADGGFQRVDDTEAVGWFGGVDVDGGAPGDSTLLPRPDHPLFSSSFWSGVVQASSDVVVETASGAGAEPSRAIVMQEESLEDGLRRAAGRHSQARPISSNSQLVSKMESCHQS